MAPLAIGFLLDLLLGDPHGWYHPVRSIGSLISRSEKIIRKAVPATRAGETAGGILLCAVVTGAASGMAVILLWAAGLAGFWVRLALESVMCYQLLAARAER